MPNEKRIQSVTNATRVLRELAAAGGPVRLGDLSRQLGMVPSSAHLLLVTLVDAGFVEQTPQGTYRLGLAVFEIGTAALQQYDLGARLAPPMEELAAKTREAVSLSVLHHGDALIVMRFESDQILRTSIRVGTRMPLFESASGRCLVAFTQESEREVLLGATGTAARRAARKAGDRVRAIRDAGFETQCDEWADGVSSIAVPVFAASGAPAAALSVSSPSSRFDPEPWTAPLRRTAETLTVMLQSMALEAVHLTGIPR